MPTQSGCEGGLGRGCKPPIILRCEWRHVSWCPRWLWLLVAAGGCATIHNDGAHVLAERLRTALPRPYTEYRQPEALAANPDIASLISMMTLVLCDLAAAMWSHKLIKCWRPWGVIIASKWHEATPSASVDVGLPVSHRAMAVRRSSTTWRFLEAAGHRLQDVAGGDAPACLVPLHLHDIDAVVQLLRQSFRQDRRHSPSTFCSTTRAKHRLAHQCRPTRWVAPILALQDVMQFPAVLLGNGLFPIWVAHELEVALSWPRPKNPRRVSYVLLACASDQLTSRLGCVVTELRHAQESAAMSARSGLDLQAGARRLVHEENERCG